MGHEEEEEEEDKDTAVKVLTNVTAGGDGKATRKTSYQENFTSCYHPLGLTTPLLSGRDCFPLFSSNFFRREAQKSTNGEKREE